MTKYKLGSTSMDTQRITIFTNESIYIDGRPTGYRVSQTTAGTIVERHSINGDEIPVDLGDTVPMPNTRYALSCRDCIPLSGIPNLNDFESDLLKTWDAGMEVTA